MKKRIRQGILVILTMLLASSVCFAADSEGTKLPDSAANTPAQPAFIEMDDGDYAIPVSLEGGSGKASVTTPAALKVKDGTAVMTLVWGSENYDYMISGGVKYQRVNEEGYSTFEIPVTSFTQPMTVIADTTAMSVPHEVEYTLTLSPDDIMAGVEYYHIPIRDEESNGNSFFERVMSCYGEGERYIQERYRSLITDEYSLKQYARFLDVLLHVKNGAVVFHSTTGEDRTGVGTALLLFALGVPKETIRRDYMRSNPCLEEELKYMRRLYRADRPENSRKLADLKAFYQVKESYINTVFDVIEKENGGIERFLRRKLYLTPKASEELKKKYLI